MKPSVSVYRSAVRDSIANRGSIRALARRPLTRAAEVALAQLRCVDLAEITGELRFTASIGAPESRHAWSLHAADQLVLQAIVAGRAAKQVFEIGTFNGGTTRVIAEALPRDGVVWTLDLPPIDFDRTQGPAAFHGGQVGEIYKQSWASEKVQQLLGNSTTFDFSPYFGKCDVVLVDGGHEYEHGLADTRAAFRLVSPGGIILWDDFQPYWHGLVRGIIEAAGRRAPMRLNGTSMGVWYDTEASFERLSVAY